MCLAIFIISQKKRKRNFLINETQSSCKALEGEVRDCVDEKFHTFCEKSFGQ